MLVKDGSNKSFYLTLKWLIVWAAALLVTTVLSFISTNAKNKL